MRFFFSKSIAAVHGLLCLLSLAVPLHAASNYGGYYPLTVGFGHYDRQDRFADQYDGLPGAETVTIALDDSVSNAVSDGYLVILSDGQVTGHWVQTLDFTHSWSGKQQHEFYSGFSSPVVTLTVDVTGTVLAESATSMTLQLQATIACNFENPGIFQQGAPPGGASSSAPTAWSAAAIPLSTTIVATRMNDGRLALPLPTITEILPALAASPAAAGGEGTEIRYLAWPQTSRAYGTGVLGGASDIPGLRFDDSASVEIGAYAGGPTLLNFDAPTTALRPVFPEHYLLGVAAPFGFIASVVGPGDMARFHYGTDELTLPISGGRALAPFDYGAEPAVISADILAGGSVLQTLTRPLQKHAVPPWAAPASAWTAAPGVRYARTLGWPVSLATSRTLADASILTGLWGVTGTASSALKVNADSLGTPTKGTLEGEINFHAAGKDIGFTLGGTHLATLNGSGLSLAGNCETSKLGISLLDTNITPLSLIPGLQSAVSGVHPFFHRLIRGSGLALRSQLSLSAAGGYVAEPLDASPRFTSGTLVGAVDVSARLNVLPEMMRGLLYFGVEGGGGLETEIQLAPSVAMTSLGGHLYFTGTASLFGLEASVGKDFAFGDYTPPAPLAPAFARSTPPASAALLAAPAAPPAAQVLPARVQPAFSMRDVNATSVPVVASVPVAGQPTPSSQITLRKAGFPAWTSLTLPSAGAMNIAPTIGTTENVPGASDPAHPIVWVRSTTPLPTTAAERETFANGLELRFHEYSASRNQLRYTPYDLTANALCDFGPSIPQVSGTEPARVFWARSQGTDFTGSTTPLTLLTRRWILRGATTVNAGWSAEVPAVTGLAHIVDWKAIVLDATNSAIVLTCDSDGNFETVDDSELWLARETNGVWAAPVRLTNNAVADEQPVMFYAGTALRLAWRQGGAIVSLADAFGMGAPVTLLPASLGVGAGFAQAYFGELSPVDPRLHLLWPDGDDLAFTVEGVGTPLAGGTLPAPRHHAVGDQTITGFKVSHAFVNQGLLEVMVASTAATPGSPSAIPTTTETHLARMFLVISPDTEARPRGQSTPFTQTLTVGDPLCIAVLVTEGEEATYQWYRNGQLIPGARSPIYEKESATLEDAGTYTLRVMNPSGATDYSAGTITLNESFASWAAAHALPAPLDTREADADVDGSANDLEYLFGTDPHDPASRPETIYQVADGGFIFDTFTFQVSAAAIDCDFAIELSRDLVTWTDVRAAGDVFSDGYFNRPGTSVAVSPDGVTRSYLVWLENAATGYLDEPPVDYTKSFMRVRMIRP